MIFQLAYESTAVQKFYAKELLELLAKSRARNAETGISGMLLYHEGRFLQLLEGPQEIVLERFERIAADERHKWVSTVMRGPSAERDFPDWSMGFRDLERAKPPAEGWTEFLTLSEEERPFPAGSSYIRNIFLAFKNREGSWRGPL